MRSLKQKSGAVALAMLLLFSTLSFAVEMHYCGDHLVDLGIFRKASTCMMQANMPHQDMASMQEDMMDCCSEIELVVEGQEDLNASFETLNLQQQAFIVSFSISFLFKRELSSEEPIDALRHPPPRIVEDIHLLNETFLI